MFWKKNKTVIDKTKEASDKLTIVTKGPERKVLNWNVIDDSEFRQRTMNVFSQVSKTLAHTLGPYGATTIIEKMGEYHITKDGWQVLKKIAFDDSVEQNILQLLVDISAQVVIKVGDGSTSSIVAANSILKNLSDSEALKTLRPRDLTAVLYKMVNLITDRIQEGSKKIDTNNDSWTDEIYRLARISTNGDDVIPKIISDIYKETKNPSIEFDKAKTSETTFEVIKGYKAKVTYLDPIFATTDDGLCTINDPLILMFNHKVDYDNHFVPIIQPAIGLATSQNRRLVVIAPFYDNYLLDAIRKSMNIEFRARGTSQVVYCRVSTVNKFLKESYSDFGILTGGIIMNPSAVSEFTDEKLKATADVTQYIGTVDKIAISPKDTLIQGLTHIDENMYKIALNDANAKYAKLEEQHRSLNIVDGSLYELKKRIAKLSCNMGIIHVGGNSSLEKTSLYDLVEDAVKACDSAFNYGYNLGGNLIIPVTINEILEDNNTPLQPIEQTVLCLLSTSFQEVFRKVILNKYTNPEDKEKILEIIESSIEKKQCYDLISDAYVDTVINPARTDMEILSAAVSIVSLILSSNQYISIKIDRDGH